MKAKPTDALTAVHASGFPFQMAIEAELERTTHEHRWEVVGPEVAWRHGLTGTPEFADLVITRCLGVGQLAVIECKRWEADLIFLIPNDVAGPNTVLTSLLWDMVSGAGSLAGTWSEIPMAQATFQAEYCVMAGRAADPESRLLEGEASKLVDAVEVLTRSEVRSQHISRGNAIVGTPILVTTAKLFVIRVDPLSVRLATGRLPKERHDMEPVDFIRFRRADRPGAGFESTIATRSGLWSSSMPRH